MMAGSKTMKAEKRRPPVAATTGGQPNAVEANDTTHFAQNAAAGKAEGLCDGSRYRAVIYQGSTGQIWRYSGKRARVLAMLVDIPTGITQWDTWPWHTRLGGTIFAMRCDGLVIDTVLEGKYRYARYRLVTPGRLMLQPNNKRAAA